MPLLPPVSASMNFEPVASADGINENPMRPLTPDIPLSETMKAGWQRDNPVYNTMKWLDRQTNYGEPDQDFISSMYRDHVFGTDLETYADSFTGVRNQKEFDALAAQIREEQRATSILAASSPGAALLASSVAGLASPTTLFPVFTVAKTAQVGMTALKSALAVGSSNVAAMAIDEAILHGTQATRTQAETGMALGGSFLLGTLLGGATGGLSSVKFKNLSEALEKLQVSANIDKEYARQAYELQMGQEARSAGAAAIERPAAELKGALGLEKTVSKTGPYGRTMNAPEPSVREAELTIVEAPGSVTRNREGYSTSPIGGSIETRTKTQGVAPLGRTLQELDRIYLDYRFGDPNTKLPGLKNLVNPDKTKLSHREFHEEVGKAAARMDEHPNPFVAKAAKVYREKLIEPIAANAVRERLLNPETVRKGRPSKAATVADQKKKLEEWAGPKATPAQRKPVDDLLNQIEEFSGVKFDKAVRDYIVDRLANNPENMDRLRRAFYGNEDMPFALRDVRGQHIRRVMDDLEDGYPYVQDRAVVDRLEAIAKDVRLSLPEGVRDVPINVMVGVQPKAGDMVEISFRGIDGGFRTVDMTLAEFGAARAFSIDGGVFLTRTDLVGDVNKMVGGEVRHELVHALFSTERITALLGRSLFDHAESLGVLDMPLRDYLQKVGDDAWERSPVEPVRDVYTKQYSKMSDDAQAEALAQEAIAHMVELRHHGALTDEQLAPILDDLDNLFGKPIPVGEAQKRIVGEWIADLGHAVKAEADGSIKFALRGSDIDVGRSMRADLDRLGYFSGALEAAKRLRQAKGTPEQMLAMLQKEGAKKAEIEATGLDKFILGRETDAGAAGDGRPSATGAASAEGRTAGQRAPNVSRNQITKSEIIKFLEDNRVEVRESRYGDSEFAKQRLADQGIDADEYPNAAYKATATKWSPYSLDPNNPTYRETVLHLPLDQRKQAELEGMSGQAFTDENLARAADLAPFRSGHFPEPNIIGHMMTSMVRHEGKATYLIDQIQSDWGQKLRDGGVRDEAKIANIQKQLNELDKQLDGLRPAVEQHLKEHGVTDGGWDGPEAIIRTEEGRRLERERVRLESDREHAENVGDYDRADALNKDITKIWEDLEKAEAKPLNQLDTYQLRDNLAGLDFADTNYKMTDTAYKFADIVRQKELLDAELYTAEAATPGHPLVNTTDQWTNTTLRRAIRQAVEADAEYIAVPTGDTVLSYNPGDTEGMWGFYGHYPREALAKEKAAMQRLAESEQAPISIVYKKEAEQAGAPAVAGIVPKNLKNILRKIDKSSPDPVVVDKLDTPGSGMKGEGFTLFPLTDKVKQTVKEQGQPLFAMRGLDMSPEARKARAEEMGFDTSRVLYHGTAVPIEAFSKLHRGGVTGAKSAKGATWLVESSDVASGYADLAATKPVADLIKKSERAERAGKWDDAHRFMAEAERLEQEGGSGQNILPVYVRGRIKEIDMDGMKYDPDDVDMSDILKEAKAEGYDGVRLTNFSDDATYGTYTPTSHVAIFDPTNIRSVNAAFDPSEAGSANLMFALRDLSRRLDAPLVDDLGKSDPHPGRVMAVHGTKAQPFDQFDPAKSADFGIHFGTRDQADIPAGYTTTRENARMIPVVLDLKTVVDVPDMMTWPPVEVAAAVEKAYPLARGLEDRVRAVIAAGSTETGPTGSVRPSREALAAGKAELRRLMTEAKIDGLRYWNDSEGEGWSYIVWDEGKVSSATSGEPMMGVKPDGNPEFAKPAAQPQPEQPRFPEYAIRSIADQIQSLTQDMPMVTRSDGGAVDSLRMGDQVYRVTRGEDGSVQGITIDAEAAGEFAPNASGLDDAGVAAVARSIREIVKRSGGPELDEAAVQDIVRQIATAIARGDDPATALRSNMGQAAPQMMFATRGDDVLRKIRQLGGIKDETGDLANMGAGERNGIINNETGLSPDAMRAHMVDEGYLDDVQYEDVTQSSVNDLYDLVSEALADQGGRGRAYREEMAYQAIRAVQQIIDENGLEIKLTPDQEDTLVRMILDKKMTPDDALERMQMAGAEDAPRSGASNADPLRYTQTRREMEALKEAVEAQYKMGHDPLEGQYFNDEIGDEVWGGTPGQSYIMRLYNHEKVIRRRTQFRAILADYFQQSQQRATSALRRMERDIADAEAKALQSGREYKMSQNAEKDLSDLRAFVDMDRAELEKIADGVIDNILGRPDLLTFDLPESLRGALKSRTLRIPDAFESASGKFEDFLDRDVRAIGRAYVHSVVVDTEIMRMHGSLDMEEWPIFQKMKDEYHALVNNPELDKLPPAKAEKIRAGLEKNWKRVTRDLQAQIARMRGVYKLPDDPTSWGPRTLRVIKEYNLIRMLGSMTVSAITDIPRVVMVHGFMDTVRYGIRPLFGNLRALRLAGDEVQMSGTALDMVLGSRIQAIADVLDNYGRYSKGERGLGWLAEKFGYWTLMNQWNSAMKQWVGAVTMTKIIKACKRVADGTATKADIDKLAASSIIDKATIDTFAARKIAEQFDKHGMVEGGLHIPNSEAWDVADPNVRLALDALRGAIVRDVDRIIVTPGQEKPLWFSTQMGSVILQFKSFAASSMEKTLIAGLQQRDAGVFMGASLMVGLGALVEYLKALTNDKPLPATNAQWIAAAIDRSGLLGWFSDVNNVTEKMTRGTVGVSALTGKELSRFASRNVIDALAGPTFGTIGDMTVASGGLFSSLLGGEQVRQSDLAAVRRLIPLQNLFYLSNIFQQLEKSAGQSLGAKRTKSRSPLMERLSSNELGPGWLDEFVRAA